MRALKYTIVLTLMFSCIACGNKSKNAEAELQAEAEHVNSFTEKLESGEPIEGVTESDGYSWEKGYLKNEFGEEEKSSPFIKVTIPGKSDIGDAELEIRFSKTYGLVLTVLGRYVDFVNTEIKAKLGNNVIQLTPTDTDNSSILFQDMGEIRKFIELLECRDIFKLSIQNTDVAEQRTSFLFNVSGYNHVKKELASIGIELGYDGNYDYHGEAPGEDDYSDPTTLDQETLQNRVYDEE